MVGGRNVSDDSTTPTNNGIVKSTFIYDINTNTWKAGADALDFQGDTCAAALDGKVKDYDMLKEAFVASLHIPSSLMKFVLGLYDWRLWA